MYTFSQDWFSNNIPSFSKHLDHLRRQPCNMLEIGTFEGRAATWLLDNILTHDEARLTCIDILEQPRFRTNLQASPGGHKAEFILGLSGRVLKSLPARHYDFIYIDGYHGQVEVLEDAVLAFRLAKVGAIISFDDYLWDDPKFARHGTPRMAVDAFLQVYAQKLEVLETGYQVWIRKTSE